MVECENNVAGYEADYALLAEPQQRLLARCSVFSIPVEQSAVEALCPEMGNLGELLSVLMQRGMLCRDGERYTCPEPLRRYAYARLPELEDPLALHRLAAEYLRNRATGAQPVFEEALEELDQWARAQAWESCVRRSIDLVSVWGIGSHEEQVSGRLKQAYEISRAYLDDPAEIQAQLLMPLALMAYRSARWDEAVGWWEKAAGVYQSLEDEKGLAQVYHNLGRVYAHRKEWKPALEFYQKALDIRNRIGDLAGMAQTFGALGDASLERGYPTTSIQCFQQALGRLGQIGDESGRAEMFNRLGIVHAEMGAWEPAVQAMEQALEIRKRLGDSQGLPDIYNNLGNVYARQGEWERAAEFYQLDLQVSEQVGNMESVAKTCNNLGIAWMRLGQGQRALELYQRAVDTYEKLYDIYGMSSTWANMGSLYLQAGHVEEAKRLLANAYLVLSKLKHPDAQAASRALIQACGSVEAANAYLARSTEAKPPKDA